MNKPPKGDEFRRNNSQLLMIQATAQDTPNMTIKIKEGSFWINGTTFVEYGGGSSPTLVAPKTGAKWAVVAINKIGTVIVFNGVSVLNNPVLPDIRKDTIPVAAVYLKAGSKEITNDMIFDIRPTFSAGGYPIEHNQLTNRDASNCHTIDSITDLQETLNNMPTNDSLKDSLNLKADANGTNSNEFILNKDETGVPTEDCGFAIYRGSLPKVSIVYSESADCWKYTNNGTDFKSFGDGASAGDANTSNKGLTKLSVDPDESDNPIAVGDNDPRILSIDDKIDKKDLEKSYFQKSETLNLLDVKANISDVYSKKDIDDNFATKADIVVGLSTYNKTEIDTFMNLKANSASVYNKTEVDASLSKKADSSDVYTKTEVDAKIGSGTGTGGTTNGYTKSETDALLVTKANLADVYTKTDTDLLMKQKADLLALSTKADITSTYTKTEIDYKLLNLSGGSLDNVYTKGEVNLALAGKANISHSHLSSDISQDSHHRLVDDEQITYWSNKQNALGFTPENVANKGANNGYAGLDSNGKIPLSQIPSSITGGVITTQTGATIVSKYTDLATVTDLVDGKIVFVIDATGDTTVKSGWAQYIYTNKIWEKIGEQESLDLILDWSNIQNKPAEFTPAKHNHDDLYYTEAEVDGFLAGKADANHYHDTRYYTKAEVDTGLAGKADTNHTHAQLHDADMLGTKKINESSIADGSAIVYDAKSGNLVYSNISSGSKVIDDANISTSLTFSNSKIQSDYYDKADVDKKLASISSTGVDLTNYYTKTEVDAKITTTDLTNYYTKSDVYTKTEVDAKITATDLTNYYTKSEVDAKITTTDLTNYYTKSDVYTKTEVDAKIVTTDLTKYYTKTEVDAKIPTVDDYKLGTKSVDESNIADGKVLSYNSSSGKLVYVNQTSGGTGGSSTGGSTISSYEADGSTSGDCMVVATGTGVKFSKSGNSAIITPPSGVQIISARIRFSSTEIGSNASCKIDYDSTQSDTDYDKAITPTHIVYNDVSGNRALKSCAVNLNTNAHTLQLTGLNSNIGVLVKLQY